MVVGHTSIPKLLSDWIWSFHMPFFFFVSGMLTNWCKEKKVFLKAKARTLLIPFVFYSMVNFIAFSIVNGYSQSGGVIGGTYYLIGILRNGWGGVALWFIPVLWMALLFVKCIFDSGKSWLRYIIMVACSIAAYCLSVNSIYLPWTLSTIPIASVYVFLGNCLGNSVKRITSSVLFCWLSFMIGFAVTIIVSHFYRQDLAANRILPFFPILIGSLSGTIMLLAVSKLLCANSWLSQILSTIGQNTLEVMCLSQCIIAVLNLYIPQMIILKYLFMVFIISCVVFVKRKIKASKRKCESL